MPGISRQYVKPLVKLSKAQWKLLLARVLEKGEAGKGKLGPRGVEEIFKHEPPVEKRVAPLSRDVFSPGGESHRRTEYFPLAEARAKYFTAPEEYVTPRMSGGGPVKEIKQTAGGVPQGPQGPQGPEEIAKGIAYERLKFSPIIPSGVESASKTIRKAATEESLERGMKRAGIRPEDLSPGTRVKPLLEERGIEVGAPPPVSETIQLALIADALWKDMGGARSMAGKLWEQYRQSQVGGIQQTFKTGRDYFISCLLKWKKDPKRFLPSHPREARLLQQVWAEMEKSWGGAK